MSEEHNPTVVVSWLGYHGRSAAIAERVGADAVFIEEKGNLALRYLRQYRKTIHTVAVNNYDTVVVMMPPLPALLACISLKKSGRVKNVIADLHTGVFEDPKWRRFLPFTMKRMRANDVTAVVTNDSLAARCRQFGLSEVLELHDPLGDLEAGDPGSYALFPVTYANDEPIDQIIGAARLASDTTFVLTGRAPEELKKRAPSNVEFPGFVSRERYEELLSSAGVVVGLTNRPFTMQRAGYEAIERGLPLITSDMGDLRSYFGDAALYVAAEPTSGELSERVTEALRNRKALAERMELLKDKKLVEQESRIEQLRGLISQGTSRSR
ncbi:glycosyltransferase [Nesterenkonia aurantiaca]|uniref:Glycosyl transferase family 1 n=1 Tax=Nesterenkonia aurantiaca TaxID=1436010 RepID=A0A4R7FVB0_9MICC|nr:glycosyltransferase [Nesterenkonia aurantiaca]TDS82693.1 glycosyl transferase family 1 [Nesterenkonia aurantiaca]